VAVRLAHDKVLRVLYGLPTDLERRRPFKDGEEEMRCRPRSRRRRPLPLSRTSGGAGGASSSAAMLPDAAGDASAGGPSTCCWAMVLLIVVPADVAKHEEGSWAPEMRGGSRRWFSFVSSLDARGAGPQLTFGSRL